MITMAALPTVLYYFGILVMVELGRGQVWRRRVADGAGGHALGPHQKLLVPLRLADLDHRA